jgi:phage gpG-like protein
VPDEVIVETSALLGRLRQIKVGAEDCVKPAAEAMAAVGERAIKQELATSSHDRGTPTPSGPGEPPSLVSGQLRRSVRMTKIEKTGAWAWTAHVAPTTVYARIQELGGWAGRGHRSHLPPRPYVKPAVLKSAMKARDAAIEVFRMKTGT